MAHLLGLHFLSMLTRAAARSDSDLPAVMDSLQLGVHAREGRPPLLPLSVLVSLLEQLEARARGQRFLFALADVLNFDDQPAVAAFMTSAENLRQLLQLLDWVPEVVHPQMTFSVAERGGEAWLHPAVRAEEARLVDQPLLIELMTAAILHFCQVIAPGVRVVEAVTFRHGPLADPDEYARFFACPVHFHAPANGICGDRRQFDRHLPGSLPQANASAAETIRVSILGDGVAPPLAVEIAQLLRTRLPLLGDGLAGLASTLQVTPRTLQRQLRRAGACYADLLAAARHHHAREMLRDPQLDIESISIKLGYRERRSFTLAFRGWEGCTPSAYRQRLA